MSITLAAALAASMTLPACSWNDPGANPFMGDVVAAVDRYTDIPGPVRAKLKARMEARQFDEIAAIRRDSITGKRKYAPEIRDMHFGQGQVCRTVTRTKWRDDMVERGLVYCESGHCILVPTVCRNVSRIKRLGGDRVASAADEPLDVPEGLTAGPTGGGLGGGAGGGGVPGSAGDAPLALNSAPGTGGGAAGEASFQSLAGLSSVVVASVGTGGVGMAWDSAGAGGGGGDSSATPVFSGGWGGLGSVPAPDLAADGQTTSPAGGGSGGVGTGDGFGPTQALPGVGVAGNLDIGPRFVTSAEEQLPVVSSVPEPGTWAVWLLGLAGVSFAARRRRRH